jgi:hypothetical protein
MANPNENWQVDVNGEVYDTDFTELTNWVLESSVLPTDKVRRGNLRWLEAGKVPMLREFFNSKGTGAEQIQVNVYSGTENNAEINDPGEQLRDEETGENKNDESHPKEELVNAFTNGPEAGPVAEESGAEFCTIHNEVPSEFVCQACSHYFCGACPNTYGASVKTCPYCGGICKKKEVQQIQSRKEFQFSRDISEGFGFTDFNKALTYPLNFRSSLFFGGLFFAIFSLGQGASGLGGIFMMVGALFCWMLANTLSFGVLANTLNNFSQGITDRDFLPRFDDFDIWDDVLHPFFLSIAVWLSSFGLMFVLIFGAVWYAWNSFSQDFANPEQKAAAALETESQQSVDHVQNLREKLKSQNDGRSDIVVGEDGLTDSQRATIREEAEFQKLSDLTKNYKKAQLESTIGKTPETIEKENQAWLSKFIKMAGVLVILVGAAFLWGVFYFPVACIVAGYTRSFMSTLNPLVGLDTIKHLGIDYLKILVMSIILWVFALITGGIVSLIFSPFNLPMFGNLPATFVSSFASFYFTVVFSVTLGYAIYKNSPKLKLPR